MERKTRAGRNFAVMGVLIILAAALLVLVNRGGDVGVDVSDGSLETDQEDVSPTSLPEPVTPSTVPQWLEEIEAAAAAGEGLEEPGGAIEEDAFDAVVRPGESIQKVVDELPEGASVLIKAGTHVGQQVKPKSGMTFVGEEGAVLDGESKTEYAFLAWEEDEIDDVTIRGLEIRNYVPIPAMAAITTHRSGWVIEDCEVHHSSASGIRVNDNGVIRDNVVHHNERLGLKPSGDNVLVEGNEVYANNLNGRNDPTHEAGGIKGGGEGVVFRDNHVYDNNGHGIWVDIEAIYVLYEHNVIENNTYSGINHEISYDAVIRNNTIRGNGHGDPRDQLRGAGIQIKGPHVEVYGNVLENNKNGVVLVENDRGSGRYGSYSVTDVYVHDNLIINSGENGGVQFRGSADTFGTSRFEHNEYRYDEPNRKWWQWEGAIVAWDRWVSMGNDVNGLLVNLGE